MAFAVIDFETTGLMPERSDRVVEVGVVLVDSVGRVEHQWTTLVNPRRDVGATHIHGIRAADLLDAPEFNAVADQVLNLVVGRAVVAHNASFDMRFLHAELARAGYAVRGQPSALCSMKWSGRLVGPAKLQHACEALGIPLVKAHSALGDAQATAALLAHLMRQARKHQEWTEDEIRSRTFKWPTPLGRSTGRAVARGQEPPEPNAWLDVVLNAAWIPGVPENEASYLLLLERALLDRQISRSEAQQLVETAERSGLCGSTAARLHRTYLHSVAQEALADGVITNAERDDLFAIAGALGLSGDDVSAALTQASELHLSEPKTGTFALVEGDRIVFTGEVSRPREEWVSAILAEGLASGSVTKSTKLVVAADPDSLSGKAAKARAYGIPIIDEGTFSKLFSAYASARRAAPIA